MNRTKVTILCFYVLNMFVITALSGMNNSTNAQVLCFSYLMLATGFIKNSLMGELKNYLPEIYEKLREEKYVNGFKWIAYAFNRSYNTTEDKNVKLCIMAHSILGVIIFIEMIILGTLGG